MKKKITIITCSIVLLITIIISVTLVIKYNKKSTIEVALWYDSKNSDTIAEISEKPITHSLPYCFSAIVDNPSDKDIEKIVSTSYYVGERNYYISGRLQEGNLLFKNNAYYFCYKGNDYYVVKTLLCELIYNHLDVFFPLPAAMWVDLDTEPTSTMFIDLFFETRSFTECKEFYSMFSEFVTIEEENKRILILGNEVKTQEKYVLIIDFNTKSFLIKIDNEIKTLHTSTK